VRIVVCKNEASFDNYSGERISCKRRDITQERGYHARGGILLRREDIMHVEGYYSGERISCKRRDITQERGYHARGGILLGRKDYRDSVTR
jgi:hypothetical protein